ncbi:helix-hairpin-helix domain-containing protein [Chryseobacterium sp.]|uniref:helix-hairpin-helix domain-containing protein n=1 Tax=Chryseobacterium sp. TaxID=1871047 RepID=UPI0011C9287B|nr:helix-hairpin-helix domain-containing protein [Chryseobacterium sp.]TXF77721.1 helix-hairpin-helix domain-containing protein [Chryseobacterium sp.]
MKSKLKFTDSKKYFLAFSAAGIIIVAALFYYRNDSTAQNTPPTALHFVEKNQKAFTKFNPNDLEQTQWMEMGFSEKQAATILKYKDLLGGNFSSKAELKKCYVISEEKFSEMEPYLLLPETSTGNKAYYSSSFGNYQKERKTRLQIPGKFNPDHFSAVDFEKMGFSEKQAAAIIKYKNYLGGSFLSKEKFSECFVISEENFRQMAPYLLLPEKAPVQARPAFTKYSYPEKEKITYQVFDPNVIGAEDWKALGFSEKQTQVILNYRERNLKGSFKSLEDIKNCFVISEEKFEELKPFIRLNVETMKKTTPESSSKLAENAVKTDFSKVDLNQITYRQLIEFGFDEKSAGMMIGFRKKLGGFVNTKQIVETYDIDKDLAQKLISTAFLDDSKVQKYTLVDAPAEWLQNHPYFKYSADKIIYYRTSNPDEKKIWKFLKLKPEYEARMRLYLKN